MRALFLFLLLPTLSMAQLPKPELIREAGIKKIDVWNHQLPDVYKDGIGPATFEKIKKPEDQKEDTVSTLMRTWYFNEQGFPFKCTASNNGNDFETHYAYDEQNRLIEQKDLKNGKVTFRQLVTHNDDSTLVYKKWSDGKLEAHYLTTLDSIMTFAYPVEKDHIPYYIYKKDSHYTETSVYMVGEISNTRKEHWILDAQGKPTSLEVEFIQHQRVTKRNGLTKSYHKVIPVAVDGTTSRVPEISYPSKNFYSEKRKYGFISESVFQNFRGDEILDRTEDIVWKTFDIKDPKYFESYTYYYNLKDHQTTD